LHRHALIAAAFFICVLSVSIAVHLLAIMYGMKEQKLTIRISRDVLDGAKRYARDHGTTLTRLVTAYLERLGSEDDPLASAPITRGLAGSLPPTTGPEEYHEYLEQRRGGPAI
jgi:hypothetical protein